MEEGSWSSCFKHRYVRMRSVPVRGNTSACLWRLKWTWPVYHSQERERIGCCWGHLAGLPVFILSLLSVGHTTRPFFLSHR